MYANNVILVSYHKKMLHIYEPLQFEGSTIEALL